MNISTMLKNTANVFKTFAVRFFDVYFLVYTVLVVLQIIENTNYIPAIAVGVIFCALNCFLKYKLDTKYFYRNIGIKYGICILVLFVTYLILCIMGKKSLVEAFIFIFSVLSLIGIFDTNVNLISFLKLLSSNNKNVESIRVIKECDIKSSLTTLSTSYNDWNVKDIKNDSVAEMLYEFLTISNDNQMGHIVVRSMTSFDDNGTEKLCIKAKNGYHLIIRGEYKHIVDMCSEIISDGELVKISDEDKDKLSEKINLSTKSSAKVICCAFKEVNDVTSEGQDNFIFAGYGAYAYDNTTIDTVVEAENTEYIKECFGESITVYTEKLSEIISKLHNDGKFVCGSYAECDGVNPPAKKQNNIKISDSFSDILKYGYLILIDVLLFASNVLISMFDIDVFNYNEIIVSGIVTFVYCSIIVFIGDIKIKADKGMYINCVINTIGVILAYFIGRYIMSNGEYSSDLFYEVTAGAMATVALAVSTVLSCSTIISFDSLKNKIFDIIVFVLLIIYFLIPMSCKAFEGYNISSIYVLTSILVAICCWLVLVCFNFIIRSRFIENGRKISD